MKIENKDNKRTILIAGFAAVAMILLTLGIYQQSIVASTTTPNKVLIDFTALPEQRLIEIAKGGALAIPIIVESPRDADYVLKISVYPDQMSGNTQASAGLVLQLDKESIALSSQNEILKDLTGDRVERASGSVLTVIATPDAAGGTYSYILEARRELQNGQALGTSAVFTITVK